MFVPFFVTNLILVIKTNCLVRYWMVDFEYKVK
jgi:hypothetical protein